MHTRWVARVFCQNISTLLNHEDATLCVCRGGLALELDHTVSCITRSIDLCGLLSRVVVSGWIGPAPEACSQGQG